MYLQGNEKRRDKKESLQREREGGRKKDKGKGQKADKHLLFLM